MTGTIINALSIVIAGFVGLFLSKGLPEKMSSSIQDGLGILIIVIGMQYAFKADNIALIGLSLACGAVLGEWGDWEAKLEKVGEKLQGMLGMGEGRFVKGFVTSTLIFCVGAMAIVGALEDGLNNNYDILLVKSMLDGIFSLIFSASMGIGVIFSAVPVFLYQGAISLGASLIKPFLNEVMLSNITALGGILIAAIGTNMLGVTKIRVANLLAGLLFVPLFMFIAKFISV